MSKHDWLRIRETLDGRSRSSRLAQEFMALASKAHLIIDIACGTGTNYRYLSRQSDSAVSWLCVDNDRDYLEIAAEIQASDTIRFEIIDLVSDLDLLPIEGEVAITASAFLDLTSKEWIERFACLAAQNLMLISTTASGAPIWHPADDLDETIEACLQSHRMANHGFGPAAGLSAAALLAQQLTTRDCVVNLDTSNWFLDDLDRDVLTVLVDSVHRRVSSSLPGDQADRWAQARHQQNREGVLKLTVPHRDLLSVHTGWMNR